MRILFLSLLAVTVCSCTVTVQDKRVSREEIATAFQQRDKVIEAMAKAIKPLVDAENKKVKK